MKIKIEDIWFKVVDKKDYPAYLAQCKELNQPVKMKMQDGKVLYKVVDLQEIHDLDIWYSEWPKVKEATKEVKPFSPLSVKLMSADGKPIDVNKNQLPAAWKPVYKKVPFIIGKSNNFQYCDTCKEPTCHYIVMNTLACGVCRMGYEM